MSYRIFLQIYHIFLQKSSNNHLYCAGPQPHVPAAYVGRPAHPDDLEEPFCNEEACRRVGTVSGSEQPDDEVVRMRCLIMRRRCIDAAADAHARRWERACMSMRAGFVQESDGAPEEASLCMVPRCAFDLLQQRPASRNCSCENQRIQNMRIFISA